MNRFWAALALTFGLITGATAPDDARAHPQATSEDSEVKPDYRAAALGLEDLVNTTYAYREDLPGNRYTLTDDLRAEAQAVADRRTLLRFLERALFLLADHHAITGSSFSNSYAVVPSYSDLWIERQGPRYIITAVRPMSPAAQAGVRPGTELVAIGTVPADRAVASFWAELGATDMRNEHRDSFAARVLAAGRRDAPRKLTVKAGSDQRVLTLENLYDFQRTERPPLDLARVDEAARIRINNALGNSATISAFDAAMESIAPETPLILDLTETPGGGNTVVARGIMGWFADRPTGYQMHALPREERETGIARQWIELVLPRFDQPYQGTLRVEVGRWTGSMGEGLALGLAELGAKVCGGPMAGLKGAIGDFEIGDTGLIVKLPFERLMRVDGTPREDVIMPDCVD